MFTESFGGTQCCKIWGFYSGDYEECRLQRPADAGSPLADFSTLKKDAKRSSETSVNERSTQRHIPEDDILHSGFFAVRFLLGACLVLLLNTEHVVRSSETSVSFLSGYS
jgi:hypothetical protein